VRGLRSGALHERKVARTVWNVQTTLDACTGGGVAAATGAVLPALDVDGSSREGIGGKRCRIGVKGGLEESAPAWCVPLGTEIFSMHLLCATFIALYLSVCM
jgi:hypothetical protein